LFQSDYRIWMQLRPLREKSCVCGNRQSAIVWAGSLCGERGMKYEILRFAQDDGVFKGRTLVPSHPSQRAACMGHPSDSGVKSFQRFSSTVLKEIVLAYI
jgi:hypothetical protein